MVVGENRVKYTLKVYRNRDNFKKRKDKDTNGISKEFLEKYYGGDIEKARKDSESNIGCWNCLNCTESIECNLCSDCDRCVRCWHCERSADCIKCLFCANCTGCKECGSCRGCTGEENKVGVIL